MNTGCAMTLDRKAGPVRRRHYTKDQRIAICRYAGIPTEYAMKLSVVQVRNLYTQRWAAERNRSRREG